MLSVDPSTLVSTAEAASGMLHPVLGSSAGGRCGRTRETPAKDHEDDEGSGASLGGKAETPGTVKPGQ